MSKMTHVLGQIKECNLMFFNCGREVCGWRLILFHGFLTQPQRFNDWHPFHLFSFSKIRMGLGNSWSEKCGIVTNTLGRVFRKVCECLVLNGLLVIIRISYERNNFMEHQFSSRVSLRHGTSNSQICCQAV